jgi:hypothetical protein
MYKFLVTRDGCMWSENGRRDAGADEWVLGEWRQVTGPLELCRNGFHCSALIPDALNYVKGSVLAEVETDGAELLDGNKSAHERMRVVRAWRWGKRDSVALAVYAAEQVIGLFEKNRPGDERPRKAIDAAKTWLADPSAAAYAYADDDAAAAAAAYAYAAYAYAAAAAAAAAAYAYAAYAYAAYDAAYDAAAAAAADAADAAAAAAAAADAAAAAAAAADAAYAAAAAAAAADRSTGGGSAKADARAAAKREMRQRIHDWAIGHTAELEAIT